MIVKDIPIPTGHLFTCLGEKGELETLSIGDYGKKHNIKADFLGYSNEINGVPNVPTMPLSEKWVITLSTQYGCAMKCAFCFPPGTSISTPRGQVLIENIKKGDEVYSFNSGNASIDIVSQVMASHFEGEMIGIELENGVILEVTPEHPILTKQNGNYTWMCAKDLTEQHDIILNNSIENIHNKYFCISIMEKNIC